jgi:N6-L-threonylcarbamoyladenine synthase
VREMGSVFIPTHPHLSRHSMREVCAQAGKVPVVSPPVKWCGDNAAMIAWAGIERYRMGLIDPLDLPMLPKWSLEDLKAGEHHVETLE